MVTFGKVVEALGLFASGQPLAEVFVCIAATAVAVVGADNRFDLTRIRIDPLVTAGAEPGIGVGRHQDRRKQNGR